VLVLISSTLIAILIGFSFNTSPEHHLGVFTWNGTPRSGARDAVLCSRSTTA
jgi:hypothetical protein